MRHFGFQADLHEILAGVGKGIEPDWDPVNNFCSLAARKTVGAEARQCKPFVPVNERFSAEILSVGTAPKRRLWSYPPLNTIPPGIWD